MTKDFEEQIKQFNEMYKLPCAAIPRVADVVNSSAGITLDCPERTQTAILNRLMGFKKTLSDEILEVSDIISSIRFGFKFYKEEMVLPRQEYTELDFLVDMADWLGDIQVYCASEMAKFGLPLKETLAIIMSSNFSKLDVDGKPIYDENGKVLKGPGYWKPEPQIKQMLLEKLEAEKTKQDNNYPKGIIWR